MSVVLPEFAEFPQGNDLWVIRAVDEIKVSKNGHKTPFIRIWFSRFKEDDIIDANTLLRTPIYPHSVSVHVVAIMPIKLGDIYQNKRRVGQVQLPEMTGNFTLATQKVRSAIDTQYWLQSEMGVNLMLNEGGHPFEQDTLLNAKFVSIQNNHATLLIPCSVIFQAFYARTHDFVLAFTAKPWERSFPRLLVVSDTYMKNNGVYVVRLAKSVRANDAEFVVLFYLNKFAKERANSIHSALLRSKYRNLECIIPFSIKYINMRFRYVPISANPAVYLVQEIMSFAWPFPQMRISHWHHQNHNHRDNNSVATKYQGTWLKKLAEPPSPSNENGDSGQEDDYYQEVNSGEEPATSFDDLLTYCSATLVTNTAFKEKYYSEGRTSDIKNPIPPQIEPKKSSSGGDTTNKDTDSAQNKGENVQYNIESRQLPLLEKLFDTLKSNNSIKNWVMVKPAREKYYRNSVSVFPALTETKTHSGNTSAIAWGFKVPGELAPRAFFVAELVIDKSLTICWIDIEKRNDKEGFSALLFNSMFLNTIVDSQEESLGFEERRQKRIHELIASVSLCTGVWGRAMDDIDWMDYGDYILCSHYLERQSDEEKKKPKNKQKARTFKVSYVENIISGLKLKLGGAE